MLTIRIQLISKIVFPILVGGCGSGGAIWKLYSHMSVRPFLKSCKPKYDAYRFKFDTNGMVTSCPIGKAPLSCVKGKTRFLVRFSKEACAICPHVGNCAVTAAIERGEGPRIQYDPGRVEYSLRRQYNQSDQFKAIYRWRAGIELDFGGS